MIEEHDRKHREFYFNGGPVGIFLGSEMPLTPGRYKYELYRGGSHYKMQVLCRTGYSPRCYYDKDGVRVSFTVQICSEYGILDLSDFVQMPITT